LAFNTLNVVNAAMRIEEKLYILKGKEKEKLD